MTSEVLQTVLDYVKAPQTDYALLITGPWGCGKTYFWKNVVEPKLRNYDQAPYLPLYTSFYGCENVKDVDIQLFLASYPEIRNKWINRFSTVGVGALKQILKRFTSFEFPSINLRWFVKTKNTIICFDDLERTNLSMKEALGYINTFVEHEGVKTVILCNEDAIRNEEDKKIYKAMKEKVVGTSLAFKVDMDTVFGSLFKEHKAQTAYLAFLSQNASFIRHLFDRSGTRNIRSLRRALSTLAVIFETIQDGNINPSLLAKQLIYAVMPASFELHGRGADPDKIRKILNMDYLFVLAGLPHLSGSKSKKTEEQIYEEGFAERYLHDFNLSGFRDAVGCPPICEYLLTGFLDRDALLEWARELTQAPDEKVERMKRLSHDPRGMEDEEFEQTASQVLHEVEAGEIEDIGSYVGLYDLFEWFADKHLITMNRQQVLDKFTDGLKKAQKNNILKSKSRLKLDISHPSLEAKTDEGRSLRQHVLEVNEEILGGGTRESIKALASRLQDDARVFMDALIDRDESGLLFEPVFHELGADDIAERILTLSNDLKSHFGMVIHERYLKRPLQPEFAVELPAITQMRDLIKKYFEDSVKGTETIPMSLFVLQGIVEVLDRTVERLQQLKQQENQSSGNSPRIPGAGDNSIQELEQMEQSD